MSSLALMSKLGSSANGANGNRRPRQINLLNDVVLKTLRLIERLLTNSETSRYNLFPTVRGCLLKLCSS